MFTLLLVIHILICISLIVVVLMQSAKGEGLAGAFGGGGGLSGAVFGGRGAASFLSKATTVLAIVFMFSCLGLSFLSSGRTVSSSAVPESAVTKAAEDQAAQQQQKQAQQPPATGQPAAGQQQGQSANPEDIFNTPPPSEKTDTSK